MGQRVEFFDIWQAGYAGASVSVLAAGTQDELDVFLDEALTVPAANPQALMTMSQNGRSFGKFANPIYVGAAYELFINSTDRTGVIRLPLTTLDGQDASDALVTAANGSVAVPLGEILGRTVNVLDQGEFLETSDPGASSTTNTATIVAAIGVIAAAGGGTVELPAGTFGYVSFSIPANVLVKGEGIGVTVLQSTLAGQSIIYSGDRAGLAELTVDGVSRKANSVGVYMKGKDETRFDNVFLKRFAIGLDAQGGRREDWKDLYIDNCNTGARCQGDSAVSGGGGGDEFTDNEWHSGRITNCVDFGLDLGYVDRECHHLAFRDIGFENNTGTAVRCKGTRHVDFPGCWWSGNGQDLEVLDGDDPGLSAENTVVGLHVSDFVISGDMSFTGKCQDVIFERGHFEGGTYTLTTVENTIVSRDCIESSTVSIAGGDSTHWMRARTILGDAPTSSGVTTGAASTEAWAFELAPGQTVFLEAKVIGNARNTIDNAVYHISQGARRPGSTLAYDAQTVNFTLGTFVTGASSGATGRIIADADGGATGTLTLRDIVGEFEDDEAITDTSGGAAVANGVLAHQNAALLGGITSLSPAVETEAGWAAIFGVTAGKVTVLVTGAAAKTVEWHVSVEVTSG